MPEELGAPETVLADTGYMNGKEVKALQEKGMKVLLYRLRKQTVEPVFGIIKGAMGFRQFLYEGP